jgi:hypothetical protein
MKVDANKIAAVMAHATVRAISQSPRRHGERHDQGLPLGEVSYDAPLRWENHPQGNREEDDTSTMIRGIPTSSFSCLSASIFTRPSSSGS